MMAQQSNDFDICIGIITSVNGIKGHVKIKSFTEHPDDLASFEKIYDETGKSYNISLISKRRDSVIAAVEGIITRNDAEKLRNTKLYIKRSELPEIKTDEFYHADLIGLDVKAEDGSVIGVVKDVVNYGAGDILEIYENASEKTVSHPFTKHSVPEVNLDKKYITLAHLEEVTADSE